MAARLGQHHTVRSFDLNGKGNCKSAREAAWGADVMITMLPDGDAVREAVLDALPSLRPGAVVIDMSSSDPAGTRALAVALRTSSWWPRWTPSNTPMARLTRWVIVASSAKERTVFTRPGSI